MARPSEYNFDLCIEICEQVTDGKNIKHVLESDERFPTFPTWCKWKRENEKLFNLYVNALSDKAESHIANIQKVQEMALKGEIEPSVANVVMQSDKWLSSKYYPKMYGDKIQQEHSGEVTTNIISLGNGTKPNE